LAQAVQRMKLKVRGMNCLSVRCLLAESECRSHIGRQPVLGISTAVHILQSENFFDAQILVTLPRQS
jgi:hypothetical protein